MVTSDDEEILCIARRYASEGVIAHRRPEELATDHATTADVLQDAVNADQKAGKFANTLILLQPTSPLRSAEDIRTALEKYESCQSGETVVSVSEVDHPTSWVGIINANGYLSGLELTGMRSQDYRKEFRLNGAVYVASTNTLRERGHLFTDRVIASVMPRSRSIDIDEAIDFTISECLIVNKNTLIEQ
jgi:N-acylneuraminate cytidylyltransferase/CMP-N,N'-diacetyllegionaminic acid synthase